MDVPHKGWKYVREYDALDEQGETIICEMCESMAVRFVQVMRNSRYPEELHCGCICAGHMSDDLEAAEYRDARLRSRARRRANFPKRKGWRETEAGLLHIEVDGCHFVVASQPGKGFKVGAKDVGQAKHTWGKKIYSSAVAAQMGCFDALEYVEAKRRTIIRAMVWGGTPP
jgi:hypothetical protein